MDKLFALFVGLYFLAFLGDAAKSFIRTHWIQLPGVLGVIAGIVFFIAVANHLSNLAKRRAAEDERRKHEKERLKQEKERLRREEEQRQAYEEQRLKQEQNSIQANLTNIVFYSKKAASELPELVRSAEQSLNHAEHEFKDGAFAPFWDAVEKAAFKLAMFNNNIQLLDRNALDYKSSASKLNGSPPPFELGLRTLPHATHTAERMHIIVRKAQKDFHFATIYEQRKTNQLACFGVFYAGPSPQ